MDIQTLFSDLNIVNAVIDRTLQLGLDAIFWKQWGSYLETKTRVFKTHLGTVTGVVAGSIIGQNDQKPLRERKNLGYGITEIAYLGDRYQMDTDRLSELQDLIDAYNAAEAGPAQKSAIQNIIDYIVDDYRQVLLAPHKRMDLVVGSMLMTGKAEVFLDDNKENLELLNIDLPFKFLTPATTDKDKFISYLQANVQALKPNYGVFGKMLMSRATFNKNIVGSSEFGANFKMILGSNQFYTGSSLITSEMASAVFTGIGLPAIEIKDDYVIQKDGSAAQVYADNRITLLPSDNVMRMRFHRPYVATDPVPGRTYAEGEGMQQISNYRTEEGRFMEYTVEEIPEFIAPNKIVNFDLRTMNGVA